MPIRQSEWATRKRLVKQRLHDSQSSILVALQCSDRTHPGITFLEGTFSTASECKREAALSRSISPLTCATAPRALDRPTDRRELWRKEENAPPPPPIESIEGEAGPLLLPSSFLPRSKWPPFRRRSSFLSQSNIFCPDSPSPRMKRGTGVFIQPFRHVCSVPCLQQRWGVTRASEPQLQRRLRLV